MFLLQASEKGFAVADTDLGTLYAEQGPLQLAL